LADFKLIHPRKTIKHFGIENEIDIGDVEM
jgi:hypothetical protein